MLPDGTRFIIMRGERMKKELGRGEKTGKKEQGKK
jgi:hypothetical protein